MSRADECTLRVLWSEDCNDGSVRRMSSTKLSGKPVWELVLCGTLLENSIPPAGNGAENQQKA